MVVQYDNVGLSVETKRWAFMAFVNPDNDWLDCALTDCVFDIKLWRCRLVLEDKQRVIQGVTEVTTA